MMSLTEQILSFAFSFIYGYFIGIVFFKIYKLIYKNKTIYKFLNSLLFTINITLIYFYIFRKINDGIINNYFLIVTFIMSYYSYSKYFTKNMSK